MAKRVTWKHNAVVSLKLREGLYTLGQMLGQATMRFYKITNTDGCWTDVDLNEVEPLFTLFIGNVVLQNLVDKVVPANDAKPSLSPCERYWIKPKLNFEGGYPFKGGNLIDVGIDGAIGTAQAPVIKENLSLDVDRDVIEEYQLTNMWGDDQLCERLQHWFDTNSDLDFLKEKVFPGYLVK